MTKFKKRILALLAGMLGLTGATVATSGVAWFTASSTVQVSGMTMQAAAEQGIVISNEGKSVWKTSATASHTGAGLSYVPTSTHDASTWAHAYADDMNNGQSDVVYEIITPADNIASPAMGTASDGAFGFNENGTWKRVYLVNSFYIQSSSTSAITGQDIYIKDLKAATPAQDLSKALRVLVKKHGDDSSAKVFAPVITETISYTVCTAVTPDDPATEGNEYAVTSTAATTAVLGSATLNNTNNILLSNVEIPAYTSNGANATQFDVYCFFEGEDVNCKSANIEATFETINISFVLGNKQHSA